MRDKDLYAQILGIKSPWQVTRVDLSVPEGEVTVWGQDFSVSSPFSPRSGLVELGGCVAGDPDCYP